MNGMAVIVDTDVVSFLLKDDTRARAYQPHLQGKTLAHCSQVKVFGLVSSPALNEFV